MKESVIRTLVAATRLGLGLGLAVLAAAPPASAQVGPASAEEIREYQADLQKAEELLQKGGERRAAKALDMCLGLYDAMLGRLGQGDNASSLLGETLFLLSVAQTRLEEKEVAIWRWVEAQNILPALRQGRLDAFPDVAAILGPHVLTPETVTRALKLAEPEQEGRRPPTPAGMSPINYPGGARQQAIEGSTEVVVIIDLDGLPVKPILKASCGVPGFDVAVMETARLWTFAPASENGQATEGAYLLSARFHLGR